MYKYDEHLANSRLLGEYKHSYEFEIQRKDSFGSKQSIAIALMTLIIGAMTAMITSLSRVDSLWQLILCTILFLTYLCLGWSLLQAFLAIRPREYSYITNIRAIDKTIRSMHDKKLSSEQMAAELNNFLVNRYWEAASVNRRVNNAKSHRFTKALIGLYLSIILLFVSLGLFAICLYCGSEHGAHTQATTGYPTHSNDPASAIVDTKGDYAMSNGDKTPKEPEPIDWPENDSINETRSMPPEETSETEQSSGQE